MADNNFLLDTHIFIWAMEENKRLSKDLKSLLINPGNKIYVSVASFWELVIKKTSDKKKKFALNIEEIELATKAAGFEVLPIFTPHILGLVNLPLHHKDPFDRILISQAKIENLALITSDRKILNYDLPLVKMI
jgi:PIN domain nuclease of toxin-antitoxin system